MNINDRLFGSPISGRVRAELDKRQQSTVGTTETDDPYAPISDTTVTPKYDLSERNPFVRMWTSVKLIDPGLVEEKIREFEFEENAKLAAKKINEKFDRKNNPVVVKPIYEDNESGESVVKKYGVFDENVRDSVDYASKTYIVGDHNYQKAYGVGSPTDSIGGQTDVIYNVNPGENTLSRDIIEGILPNRLEKNPLLKPQAGITSVTSETQEFLGVIKKTTVSFIVHNFYDYDRIYNRYFLKPGATVFVDFGWSDIDNIYNPEELINAPNIKEFLYGTRRGVPGYEDEGLVGDSRSEDGVVTRNEGRLEVIQGLVTDYTSRILPNGSVECTVTLTSTNSALLSQKMSNSLKTSIMNTLRDSSVYLGVIPIIEQFIESKEEQQALIKYLLTADKVGSYENYEEYDEAIMQLMKIDSLEGNFVPMGNSVRTGVYINELSNYDHIYVSWGFIEDIILNEKFGFGKDEKEINEGQQLNVRLDSSNSFTHFSNKQLQKQSNLANGDASPVFLYPGIWGNDLSEQTQNSDNDDTFFEDNESSGVNGEYQGGDNTRGVGSRTVQKNKYPKDFYKKSDNHFLKDRGLSRIPIREIFINVTTIEDSFSDANTVKQFVENLLYHINEASGDDEVKLFDWKMTSGGSGSEIIIVDNNKVDSFRRVKDSGLESTNQQLSEREQQNIFFNSLFTFNIMSPTSIIKEYNLEFNLPSGNIGNMYAIQAMSHDNKVLPTTNLMDDAIAMSAMDKKSLSIVYQPDMGGHRAEQMGTDSLKEHNQGYNRNIEKLMSTDIYDIGLVRPENPLPKTQFSSQQESSLGDKPSPSNDDTQPKLSKKDRDEIIDTNTEYLNGLGFRIVNNLDEYYNKTITLEKEVSIVERPNLLPFTISLTIYGISTIQPGDTFRVDYLPQIYQKNVFLQTMNVLHNVNSDGWFTTISAQFRPLPSIKKTHYVDLTDQAKPFLSPKFIITTHADSLYAREFYSVSEAQKPYGNIWDRPSNKPETVHLLDLISEMIEIEPFTPDNPKKGLGYENIINIYKFKFREKLSNQSLQKTLFEGKKGIYNAHYALIISTEEADNANAHTTEYQVMKDEYGFGYLRRPIVLEPSKVFYLVIHSAGVTMITDEEGVKKKNLKFFDKPAGNLTLNKYRGLQQILDENVPELELKIQEDVLYIGDKNIFEYKDYLEERRRIAQEGDTEQLETLDKVWNNPELVTGGKKTSTSANAYIDGGIVPN